jgi:hypothetical protein
MKKPQIPQHTKATKLDTIQFNLLLSKAYASTHAHLMIFGIMSEPAYKTLLRWRSYMLRLALENYDVTA